MMGFLRRGATLTLLMMVVSIGRSRATVPEGVAMMNTLKIVPEGAGVRVVVSADAPFEYSFVEKSASRLVLDFTPARLREGEQTLAVNLANLAYIKLAQAQTVPAPVARLEAVLAGPVHVAETWEGKNCFHLVFSTAPPPPVTHESITQSSIIIDLHNDVLTQLYERKNPALFEGEELEMSWPRLKRSGLSASIFAAWIPLEFGPGEEDALIELFYEMIYKHREEMAFAASYADLERNRAEGKFSAFLAIEGGQGIGQDLRRLDYYYNRGVRYMTLVWNVTHWICDSARDPHKPYGGLSPFGRQVVKRMNELGMIIDVSHASDATVDDVLALSTDPIIASHSNCRAVHNHPRNLTDKHIQALCQGGGVIGMNFFDLFLTSRRPARIDDVIKHIDHLVQVGGIDCVALGSDFDGKIHPPADLRNISELENLTAALLKHGYSEDDIKKIYGRNFLRVLRQVVDE
jgi:membrane dipeptidase